jgi:hypothetical protein
VDVIASMPSGALSVAWTHVRAAPSVRPMAALLVVGLLHDRLAPYGWIESRVGR